MGNDLHLPENLGFEFETEEETLRHLTEDKIVTSQYFCQKSHQSAKPQNDYKTKRRKKTTNYPIFVPEYYCHDIPKNKHQTECTCHKKSPTTPSQKEFSLISLSQENSPNNLPQSVGKESSTLPKIQNNNLEDDPSSSSQEDLICSQYFQKDILEGSTHAEEVYIEDSPRPFEELEVIISASKENSSGTKASPSLSNRSFSSQEAPKTPTRENSTQAKRSPYCLDVEDGENFPAAPNFLKVHKTPSRRDPIQAKRSPYFLNDEDGENSPATPNFLKVHKTPSRRDPIQAKPSPYFLGDEENAPETVLSDLSFEVSPICSEGPALPEERCSQFFSQKMSSPDSPCRSDRPGSSLLRKLKKSLSQISQVSSKESSLAPSKNSLKEDYNPVSSFEISEDPYGSLEIVSIVSKGQREEDPSDISSEGESIVRSQYFSQEKMSVDPQESTQKQSLNEKKQTEEGPVDQSQREILGTKEEVPKNTKKKKLSRKKGAVVEELEDMEVCKEFQPNKLYKFANIMKKRKKVKLQRSDSPKIPPGGLKPLWTPPKSPHCLIEEDYVSNPWGLLVATIFLNKTSGRQAKPCIDSFLKNYPTPQSVISKKPEDFECYFEELGLKKRSEQIWKMSKDFLEKNWRHARELHGIGKYGDDAFRLFCIGDLKVEPNDRYLKIYHRWVTNKDKWKE